MVHMVHSIVGVSVITRQGAAGQGKAGRGVARYGLVWSGVAGPGGDAAGEFRPLSERG